MALLATIVLPVIGHVRCLFDQRVVAARRGCRDGASLALRLAIVLCNDLLAEELVEVGVRLGASVLVVV